MEKQAFWIAGHGRALEALTADAPFREAKVLRPLTAILVAWRDKKQGELS